MGNPEYKRRHCNAHTWDFRVQVPPPKAVSYPQEAEGTSLKADSPILGSNRPVSGPYVNEQANGLEPQPRTQLSGSVRPTPYDRSVLSMPATSAGVTLGT